MSSYYLLTSLIALLVSIFAGIFVGFHVGSYRAKAELLYYLAIVDAQMSETSAHKLGIINDSVLFDSLIGDLDGRSDIVKFFGRPGLRIDDDGRELVCVFIQKKIATSGSVSSKKWANNKIELIERLRRIYK